MVKLVALSLDKVTPQIRAPGAGNSYQYPREIFWSTGKVTSEVADGATAVAFDMSTPAYVTAGAKLLSLKNDVTEKFSVDKDGNTGAASIQLDTAAGISVAQGQMAWNADEETVDIGLNGAVLQAGQEVHYHARNNTGVLIPDGTAVMATGTLGASGRITIGLMDGSDITNAKFFLGITTEAIADGTDGKVTFFGKVRGIKTDYATWANGDVLWVDNATPGGLTNVEPTSGSRLPIAFIISAHATTGVIAVRSTDGTYLAEAHDSQIASPVNGETLQYNGTAWVNSASGTGFTADSDTQITPTVPIVLDHATNNEIALDLQYTVNKAAGNDTGLVVNQTDTASPGTSLLANFQVGGVSKASINPLGAITSANIIQGVKFVATANPFQSTWANPGVAGSFTSSVTIANINSQYILNLVPTLSQPSGSAVNFIVRVAPTYNQTGTQSNTDLLINRTETALGSGSQYLFDMQVGGVSKANFDNLGSLSLAKDVSSLTSDGFMLRGALVASSTDPTLLPANGDLNTGVGRASTDQLSLIAGGIEGLRLEEASSHIIQVNEHHTGITASTTQTQVGAFQLLSSYNQVATVANDDDAVKLFDAAVGRVCGIGNQSSNILQIFPASGDDLGNGVDQSIQLHPKENIVFAAGDSTNWAIRSTTERPHAQAYDEDNTDAFVVNAQDDLHSYHTNGIVGGELLAFTFDAGGGGTSFPIASIADGAATGVDIEVTTTGSHGLAVDDVVSQTNLTSAVYTGIFVVKAIISVTQYEVEAVFTATDTGTMDQAATLTADPIAEGDYSITWYSSATSASSNETFDYAMYKNATRIPGTKTRRKFGIGGDFGSMSGGALTSVVGGDKLSFVLSNTTSGANATLRDFTIVVTSL